MTTSTRTRTSKPVRSVGSIDGTRSTRISVVWTCFVVAALVALDAVEPGLYGVIIPVWAAAIAIVTSLLVRPSVLFRVRIDRADIVAVAVLYGAVVGLFRLAFGVFTTDNTIGMFLSFATALLLGVAGPIAYTVWIRQRPLRSLGIGRHQLRTTAVLALVFGGVQFAITLWGYDLPRPVDWVPLLVMALTVGAFESVFFRGFVQGRLEASLGIGPAVAVASVLYAFYHVGYGMAADEMLFLFGLGVVYAIAYRLTENALVLWPLLTPLGSFFAQLEAGDLAGELPWAAIAGFADVLGLMALALWVAFRRERRRSMQRTSSRRGEVRWT